MIRSTVRDSSVRYRVANKDILRWSAMMLLLPRRSSEPHGLNIRHAIDMPRNDACSVNWESGTGQFPPCFKDASHSSRVGI